MKDSYHTTAQRLEEELQRRQRLSRMADENARRAAIDPDREKLRKLAHAYRIMPLPVLTEKHAQDVLDTFIDRLGAELDQFERAIAGA